MHEGPPSNICVFAAFLAVFVAAGAASQNRGFGALNVINVLLNDVTAKVFAPTRQAPSSMATQCLTSPSLTSGPTDF